VAEHLPIWMIALKKLLCELWQWLGSLGFLVIRRLYFVSQRES